MFDDSDIVGLGLAGRRRPAEDTPSALDRIVEEAVQKAETVERDAKRLEGAGVSLGTLTQLHINAAVRKAREAEHAATTQPEDQATIVAQEAVSKAEQAAKRLADDRKQPRNADAVANLLAAEAKAAKQKFREAKTSASGTPDEDPAVTRAKRAAKAAKKAAKIVEEAVQKAETIERDAKRLEGAGVNLGTLTQLHINAAVRKAREAEHAATTQPEDQATIVAQEAVSKAEQAAKRLADDRKQPRNADAVANLLAAEAKAAKQKFREAKTSASGTPDEDPAVTRAKRAAKAAKKAAKTADLVRENEQTRRVTEAEKSRRGLSFGHIVLAILVALFVWYVVLPMGLMAGCAAILAAVAGQAAG